MKTTYDVGCLECGARYTQDDTRPTCCGVCGATWIGVREMSPATADTCDHSPNYKCGTIHLCRCQYAQYLRGRARAWEGRNNPVQAQRVLAIARKVEQGQDDISIAARAKAEGGL